MLVQIPESSWSATLSNIALWVTIFAIAYLVYRRSQKEKVEKNEALRLRQERDEKLESEYKAALRGSDRAKALELGRIYYGNKREGGALTIYDEQALTNDLSTMK
jgi:hypothetical protein